MIKDFKCTFNIENKKWKILMNNTRIAINQVDLTNASVPLFLQYKYNEYPTYKQEGEKGTFVNDMNICTVYAFEHTNHGYIEIYSEFTNCQLYIPYLVAKALQTLGNGSSDVKGCSFSFCKKYCECLEPVKQFHQVYESSMENLLKLLKQLEKSNFEKQRYLNYNFDNGCEYCSKLVKEQLLKILAMVDELLIDSEGNNNWDNMEVLQKHQYYVYPGEQDRFGWLTGCIDTQKGTIVFG